MAASRIARFRAAARQVLRKPIGTFLRMRETAVASRIQHELAVCAIFREEAPFLHEWLTFHATIGATHFYLYNNGSTDNFQEVLVPWCNCGLVTLQDWVGPVQQVPVYADCVRRARATCRWVAFIDVDEFLFSPLCVDVRPILRGYQDLPGLVVWEAFFGSSGHARRPDQPVTLTYRQRAPVSKYTSAKTIANPRLVYKAGVHEFKFWGAQARDTSRRPVAARGEPMLETLRINHYWSRSLEDLDTKISRGDAWIGALRDRDWHRAFERTLNVELDETILPVARQACQRMVSEFSTSSGTCK